MYNSIGITSDIQGFVNWWNITFPVDYYWRSKHNISFNSLAHQESCFIDQCFEYLEDLSYHKAKSIQDKKEVYQPGHMNWLKPKKYSEKEIDEMFNSLDIENM